MILGIDPGLKGGLAFIGSNETIVHAEPMPTNENMLDIRNISDMVSNEATLISHAFIEKATAMPKQGSVSMFKFGRVFGALEGILAALRIPYTVVPPKKWQAAMCSGVEATLEPKARALIAAQRMYPHYDFRASNRCRVAHDGIVDAVLIARYGVEVGKRGME